MGFLVDDDGFEFGIQDALGMQFGCAYEVRFSLWLTKLVSDRLRRRLRSVILRSVIFSRSRSGKALVI